MRFLDSVTQARVARRGIDLEDIQYCLCHYSSTYTAGKNIVYCAIIGSKLLKVTTRCMVPNLIVINALEVL